MKITSLEDLKHRKRFGLTQLYPDIPKILVGMATCGQATGARQVYERMKEKIRENETEIVVEKTGCIGFCYKEPLVDVIVPGKPRLTYERVNPELAEKIVENLSQGRFIEESIMARLGENGVNDELLFGLMERYI